MTVEVRARIERMAWFLWNSRIIAGRVRFGGVGSDMLG